MIIKINSYDSCETGYYHGKWQIRVGRIDKEGIFRPHFQSVRKKDGSTLKVPVSLTFDTDADAIEFFKACAKDIG